jgi:hypothetical protein
MGEHLVIEGVEGTEAGRDGVVVAEAAQHQPQVARILRRIGRCFHPAQGGVDLLQLGGPLLLVADNPAIENADRITIEAWVNTLSWRTRAVICRKDGSYTLCNYSGGFSWYLFGPRTDYDIAVTPGNGAWGYIAGTL